MHSIHYLLAGVAVAGSLLHAQESQLLNDGLLVRLRSEAARTHPAALAGKHRAAAVADEVRVVRLWDDPMVGLGFMGAEQMMRANEGDIILGLEQRIPKPGMFEAEKRKAEAMRRAELANSQIPALAAGAEAARNAIELALADESISLQHAQVVWLTEMVENARQMAADPMGSATDALRLETELVKEQQMLDAARRTREGYATRLNLTLGRPFESRWPVLKLPVTPLPVPITSSEIARIPHANPKVRAMKEMVAAANAETRIADRDRLPQVSVGLDSRIYSGGDYRSTMVGVKMSLPWFNDSSYHAKISAAKSRELSSTEDVETMRREVAAMVVTTTTEAANAAAQARAYSGAVYEKALQASKAIEASWISSKSPLTDLLDSSRTLFAIRLEQRRFIAMQLAALEELQTLVPHH